MTESYKKLLQLFEQLEPLQKKVEGLGNGLDGPALNETRNATYHLLKALQNNDVQPTEITKAERHAQRAIYDCHEAILLHELEKLRIFREDYKSVVVTQVLPKYLQGGQNADKAKRCIDDVRTGEDSLNVDDYESGFYSQPRSCIYTNMEPYIYKIQAFNEECEAAREELNKIIHKENNDKVWAFLGKIAAIVTIIGLPIAVLAWLYPVK